MKERKFQTLEVTDNHLLNTLKITLRNSNFYSANEEISCLESGIIHL